MFPLAKRARDGEAFYKTRAYSTIHVDSTASWMGASHGRYARLFLTDLSQSLLLHTEG
jgi:hypothetical protein